ncbi:TIR protein [Mycobacteroides abscessus subsp. abscessus]|uniref:toll/interleukin-1 receptor domain-containing protein n=1 Tax=Mycobacteroides abscessus TaxID=36809 RepID=UPI000925E548|nr:toll/interleukin-1 receptor domain-containing protein [Mycobacteroides abscessus]SHT15845.1 TIR protein [Mycobacteroides abscessus subsp. abscessus]SHU41302.1 TIR protein [Mycobacteroides abscessus subsp. abscessus]SHU44978.1 TIR protein [Mycobacteroides abscessus subsp. abscessus]SHX88459.1 TIR protein [Mycobacteroides abscessus subsp. abscessus]SIA94228.1 TIR protein [Mycobacteroides abscessus subsp. abscessus]
MNNINRQAHFWEASVLDRTPVLEAIRYVNRAFPGGLMTGFNIYIHPSPYVHEFYISMYFDPDYKNAKERISKIYHIYTEAGAKRRSDIISDDLLLNFNSASILPPDMEYLQPLGFALPTREFLHEHAVEPFASFAPRPKVFLSHNSDRKDEVGQLQEQFSAKRIATWFDKTDIEYGQTLVSEIERGIESSGAVVFWWSEGFLKSNWCEYEVDGFLDKIARLGRSRVRIFSIVDDNISDDRLPRKIRETKYLRVGANTSVSEIVNSFARPIYAFLENIPQDPDA